MDDFIKVALAQQECALERAGVSSEMIFLDLDTVSTPKMFRSSMAAVSLGPRALRARSLRA